MMNRQRLALPALGVTIAAVLAVVVATAGGSTTKTRAIAPAASALSIKQSSIGKALVDANGRTLYLFKGDRPNVSTLSAGGRAVWPPLTANAQPKAAGGAVAARIGLIAGANGTMQVTYSGHPLYYYVGDHKSGQTLGQGLNEFGGRWYVLSAGGRAITSAPATSAPSTTTGGGASSQSYGY
jgi:predicted lipoprotein with Yx(FWY)xxD motif